MISYCSFHGLYMYLFVSVILAYVFTYVYKSYFCKSLTAKHIATQAGTVKPFVAQELHRQLVAAGKRVARTTLTYIIWRQYNFHSTIVSK